MRFVYFANNRLGLDVLGWLTKRGEFPVALVIHPASSARYRDEIAREARVRPELTFEGPALDAPDTRRALADIAPDLGVSVQFGYVLSRNVLDLFPRGCLNLHPALLPYNRGGYPNVWSIVERTPAGVTLHYMDETIDTGDVVAQAEVSVLPTDTGQSLYHRLERTAADLFARTWPAILEGTAPRIPQQTGGTRHRTRDVDQIDRIDLDRCYRARDLIDILRARTFPPYRGAFFESNGRRIYVSIALEEAEPVS